MSLVGKAIVFFMVWVVSSMTVVEAWSYLGWGMNLAYTLMALVVPLLCATFAASERFRQWCLGKLEAIREWGTYPEIEPPEEKETVEEAGEGLEVRGAEIDEEQNLYRHWEKSREYRVKLASYAEKLKKREQALNAREVAFKKEMAQSLASLEQRREQEEERIERLREVEATLLDWFSRAGRKERALLDELSEESKKVAAAEFPVLDGYEFEKYVAAFLREEKGYSDVTVTAKSQDFGADIVAKKDGIIHVFQCKYYSNPVGIEAVQQIYAAKTHYNAHVAIVATNNVFTKAAKQLAEELNVVLWDCQEISPKNEPGAE